MSRVTRRLIMTGITLAAVAGVWHREARAEEDYCLTNCIDACNIQLVLCINSAGPNCFYHYGVCVQDCVEFCGPQ